MKYRTLERRGHLFIAVVLAPPAPPLSSGGTADFVSQPVRPGVVSGFSAIGSGENGDNQHPTHGSIPIRPVCMANREFPQRSRIRHAQGGRGASARRCLHHRRTATSSLEIVTLDERLAATARKEGFVLIEVPSVGA
jgi:hypothetical protein